MTLATPSADRKSKNSNSAKKPIWSWRHAIEESLLAPLSKLLAFALANDLSDTGKYTQRPTKELARVCGMSIRSVENHAKKLTDMNLLHIEVIKDAHGRPTGRRWFPRFPDEFRLDDGYAGRAEYSELDAEHYAPDAEASANDAVGSAPDAEHIDTFPDSFPKDLKDSCQSQAPDSSQTYDGSFPGMEEQAGAGPEQPAGAGPSEVPPEPKQKEPSKKLRAKGSRAAPPPPPEDWAPTEKTIKRLMEGRGISRRQVELQVERFVNTLTANDNKPGYVRFDAALINWVMGEYYRPIPETAPKSNDAYNRYCEDMAAL